MSSISKNRIDVREITNRYTDQRLVVPEIINELVDPGTQLNILRELSEHSLTPAGLDDRQIVSRKTAHSHLTTFTDRGWSERNDGQYELTAAGAIVLRQSKECLDTVGQKGLAALTRTSFNVRLLCTLNDESIRPSDLAGEERSPSRSRITQIRHNFEEHGWIQREQGLYGLTAAGERALRSYNSLASTIEQVIDKAPCLRFLPPECGDLPVLAFEGAEMIIRTGKAPYKATNRYIKLAYSGFHSLRSFNSFYDAKIAEAYLPAIKSGTEIEQISSPEMITEVPIDDPTYRKIATEGFRAENCRWLIHRHELPIGLAIFDENRVFIAPRDPVAVDPELSGTILSTDEEVVEWATKLYECYRKQSMVLSEYLFFRIRDFAPEF